MRKLVLLAPLLCLLLGGQVGPFPFNPLPPFPNQGSSCTPSPVNIGTNTGTVVSSVVISSVTVPAGAAIFVVVTEVTNATIGNVVDSTGTNVYTLGLSQATSGADAEIAIFASPNVAAINNGTITYTLGTANDSAAVSAFYSKGIATTSPRDTAVNASNATTSTSPTVTSGTPAQSGELFIGLTGVFPGSGTPTMTQDTTHGWATPPNAAGTTSFAIAGGTQVNSGVGTKIFSPTWSSNGDGAIGVVGYKHC